MRLRRYVFITFHRLLFSLSRLTNELSVFKGNDDDNEVIILEKVCDSLWSPERIDGNAVIDLKNLENILIKFGISPSRKEVNVALTYNIPPSKNFKYTFSGYVIWKPTKSLLNHVT